MRERRNRNVIAHKKNISVFLRELLRTFQDFMCSM